MQKKPEGNTILNDVVDLRPNGSLELRSRFARRVDLPGDKRIAVFNARVQQLKQQLVLGLDVVVQRALQHADITGHVLDAGGVKSFGKENVGGALQDFFESRSSFGLLQMPRRFSRPQRAWHVFPFPKLIPHHSPLGDRHPKQSASTLALVWQTVQTHASSLVLTALFSD